MSRILIVDDSPTVGVVMRKILSLDGHQVDTLRIFVELLNYLKTTDPDLILLDMHMPMLNGFDFGRAIRRNQRRPIPVLIHSSATQQDISALVLSVQAVGWIPKGSSVDYTRQAVAQALRKGKDISPSGGGQAR